MAVFEKEPVSISAFGPAAIQVKNDSDAPLIMLVVTSDDGDDDARGRWGREQRNR